MPRGRRKKVENDTRIRWYFRAQRSTRDQFRAVALLEGETMEALAERVIRDYTRQRLAVAPELVASS